MRKKVDSDVRMEPFVISMAGIAQCLRSPVLFWSDDGVSCSWNQY